MLLIFEYIICTLCVKLFLLTWFLMYSKIVVFKSFMVQVDKLHGLLYFILYSFM
jgi:hypothetical protein